MVISTGHFRVKQWSKFPKKLQQNSKKLEDTLGNYQKEICDLQNAIENAKSKRVECKERDQLMGDYVILTDEKFQLEADLLKYRRFDKSRLVNLEKEKIEIERDINATTDDIFMVKKWIKKMMPGSTDKDIDLNFGIPENFDNV